MYIHNRGYTYKSELIRYPKLDTKHSTSAPFRSEFPKYFPTRETRLNTTTSPLPATDETRDIDFIKPSSLRNFLEERKRERLESRVPKSFQAEPPPLLLPPNVYQTTAACAPRFPLLLLSPSRTAHAVPREMIVRAF